MGDEEMGMSPMREAAIQVHELYEELKAAGFKRSEAMELVSKILASAVSEQQRNSE